MDIWVKDYESFKRLEDMRKSGKYEIKAPAVFKSSLTHEGEVYYVFESENDRFFLTEHRIEDVFGVLDATVACSFGGKRWLAGHTFEFDKDGMTVDGKKKVKFVYDSDMIYSFGRYRYKSTSPYGFIGTMVDYKDFWGNVIYNGMKKAGYIE